MSCERAVEENSQVVVEIPTSWRDRRRACCINPFIQILGGCVIILFFLVIIFSPIWIPLLPTLVVKDCQKSPTLSLENVNILNMVVYRSNTTDSPYQVRSEFSMNLMARNPNTITKCFSTFRRMNVSVEYEGQPIVQHEVPLGFGLKPKERRTVMLDLRGDGYPLRKGSALLLDLMLRTSSDVDLVFIFKSRVMRNDRKARWLTTRCDTIIRTLPNHSVRSCAQK